MELTQVFENNKNWIAGKLQLDKEYFENLAKGQSPEILYIGCSDSRVPIEGIIGAEPGEVFVHRNVANVVDTTDVNLMSVVNYAVAHLKVKHLVVCGHYGCGGVKAAMGNADLGIINPWLKNIKDVYRIHQAELDAISDENARYERLIELNVQEQCINVIKNPEVQQAYQVGNLQLHGWVFDIKTGELIDLKLDIPKLLEGIFGIYEIA